MQIREQVNETIIQALEQGKVPWRSDHGFPRDILNRGRVSGLNAILLMLAADRHNFTSSYWGTQAEWDTLDGRVKGGSGTLIVLGGLVEALRSWTVYNLSQIDGDFPISRNDHPTVDYGLVDRIIANVGADIRFTDERVAEYHYPQTNKDGDFIKMCRKEHFLRGQGGIGAYYHSVFHELAHHSEPRLNWYGPEDVRELRAEIGSDFLTTELNIPDYSYPCRKNIHKFLGAWIKRMRRDPKMIFQVARDATEAVDFVLSFTAKVEPRHEPVEDEVK
jgi:antirestriction protein ArdC